MDPPRECPKIKKVEFSFACYKNCKTWRASLTNDSIVKLRFSKSTELYP